MLANWGAAAAVTAVLGLTQPLAPTPSPDAPILELPARLDPTRPTDPPTGPRPSPLHPRSLHVAVRLGQDGRLAVTEQVFVQANGSMTRHAPLRLPAGVDRVYTVDDVTVHGNGDTEVTADEFVLRAGEGVTTIRYLVDGAVVEAGDHQEVRWQLTGGWDTSVSLLRASFVAPELPTDVVCLAGRRGSDTPCESALTDRGRVLRIHESDLPAGERVDLEVRLPAGTVGTTGRFDPVIQPSAFAVTPISGVGLGLLALVLVGGFALLWLARLRDSRALATDVGPVRPLVDEGGRVVFASPDGVLPGQVGTVVDEQVDAADVTATVLDLAVRNYLSVRRQHDDWVLLRRNAPDAALSRYERAVDAALLGDAEQVSLADLRGCGLDLTQVREDLYAGVVRHDWFTRRPDHERTGWMVLGFLLAVAGVVATVVLTLTVGHALLGLGLVAAGLGVAAGARFMPARTRRGSVLVRQLRGVLGYLRGDGPARVPAADREMVLSRSLPYAVVLGETEGWLARFAGLTDLYWYEGDLAELPAFLRELDALVAAAGRLR
ncbi:DUF2207 family protein [Actinophytocola xanthii]|uniref:DUF2207 domain-containing protein n=1 Tax=Actinophytocola xanthii TaxID=1912961 RepID=A0A1Q8CPW7_9PSEU|nr:DUF2207 domain-containing protein [Actinophytocola xanthii]OLF16402.1 hypothetical protein BU204_16220 [Actinophytocola xanthii]